MSSKLLSAEGKRILEKLSAELDRRGFSHEEIGRLSKISMWQGLTKDEEGEAHVHDLYGFQLSPGWEEGPEWPVVQPAAPVKVSVPGRKPNPNDVCDVTLPDIQFGYWRDQENNLQPIHDEAALEVCIAWCRKLQPRHIVLHGDNLDLPNFGKYRKSPAFAGTTQAAIDACYLFLSKLRAACPDSLISWVAGNHDERLANWIVDNAMAAHGLREAMRPDDWPVLSIPKLCRLDELGVTFLPGYPAASVWLTENLVVVHGHLVKSNGSTAEKYVAQHKVSVIYGHVHRIERLHHTRHDFDGPKEIMAASPGCLCRNDGAVPGVKGGVDLDGRPLIGSSTENWQQGFGVIWHHGNTWHWDQGWIDNGVGYLGREKIEA